MKKKLLPTLLFATFLSLGAISVSACNKEGTYAKIEPGSYELTKSNYNKFLHFEGRVHSDEGNYNLTFKTTYKEKASQPTSYCDFTVSAYSEEYAYTNSTNIVLVDKSKSYSFSFIDCEVDVCFKMNGYEETKTIHIKDSKYGIKYSVGGATAHCTFDTTYNINATYSIVDARGIVYAPYITGQEVSDEFFRYKINEDESGKQYATPVDFLKSANTIVIPANLDLGNGGLPVRFDVYKPLYSLGKNNKTEKLVFSGNWDIDNLFPLYKNDGRRYSKTEYNYVRQTTLGLYDGYNDYGFSNLNTIVFENIKGTINQNKVAVPDFKITLPERSVSIYLNDNTTEGILKEAFEKVAFVSGVYDYTGDMN
jgi:hypothetical protein